MNCEEIKRNLVEYWRGALDGSDRSAVESHLATCNECRAEAESLKHVWSAMGEFPEAGPGLGMRTRFYASLREWERREIERRHRFWWLRHPAFQAAAAVLILLVGFVAGNFSAHSGNSSPKEVSDLRTEVNSMKQLVTLSLLQQQNASDRLRGVTWSYRVEESDPEVLGALLTTIDHDPNVPVRLAAVYAMKKFSDSTVGRRGLVQALSKQSEPEVEIAIMDELLEMREVSAKPALQALAAAAGTNPAVKQHAEQVLRKLQ